MVLGSSTLEQAIQKTSIILLHTALLIFHGEPVHGRAPKQNLSHLVTTTCGRYYCTHQMCVVPALAEDVIGPLAAAWIPWSLLEQRPSDDKVRLQDFSSISNTTDTGDSTEPQQHRGVWSPNTRSDQTEVVTSSTLWHLLSKRFSLPWTLICSYNWGCKHDKCSWTAFEDLLWYIVNNVQEIIPHSNSVTSCQMEIQIRSVGSAQSMHDGCNKRSFSQVLRNEIWWRKSSVK